MNTTETAFTDFSLKPEIIDNLISVYNITEPNIVQIKSNKAIAAGKDIIVSSPTGSGKTLAYLLPLIARTDISLKTVQVIITAPSQELCIQIGKIITELYGKDVIASKVAVLIGDGNISRQIEQLKKKPVFVIGTPQRLRQLIEAKKLHVHDVKTLVFDEADKLFDKNNYDDIAAIRKSCMKRTQVLLFSASITNKTIKQASAFTFNPVIHDLNQTYESPIPTSIKHYYVVTDRRERIETLRKIVKALKCEKAIIFINSRYDLDETFQKLEYHHYKAASISGSKDKQMKRKAISDFANGDINFLLSTDISARGLQFDNIDVVVNLNLPEESTDYQHRAGRCGRNGKTGICISIITENELDKIKKLQKQFNINMVKKKLYNGKLVSG
jgi:superfamily II DNA/RNA helicase